MAWTNPDGCMHAKRMHIYRTEIVTTMSRSPQAGSTINYLQKVKVSHALWAVRVSSPLYLGHSSGALSSPFDILSFPDSTKGTHLLLSRQTVYQSLTDPSHDSTFDLLHHKSVALTTQPQRTYYRSDETNTLYKQTSFSDKVTKLR